MEVEPKTNMIEQEKTRELATDEQAAPTSTEAPDTGTEGGDEPGGGAGGEAAPDEGGEE